MNGREGVACQLWPREDRCWITLTCAEPRIGTRVVEVHEITIRANAPVGVGRVGVGHTVIGARLVVVGVHVSHVGGIGVMEVERRV